MLDQKHSRVDIIQALNDLEAMKNNIKQYAYENIKKLLQDHLDKWLSASPEHRINSSEEAFLFGQFQRTHVNDYLLLTIMFSRNLLQG